jgi:hypothetical protein
MSLLIGGRCNVIANPVEPETGWVYKAVWERMGVLIDGCPNRLAFEPIASEPAMLLGNGKPDDLFVATRTARGPTEPAGVSLRNGKRIGGWHVTKLIQRNFDLAASGALPWLVNAPDKSEVSGTNSSGSCRVFPSRDCAGDLIPMVTYGR